jgi:hypothetical protein
MRLKATSALELTKGKGEGDVSTIVHFLRHENCGNPKLVVRKLFLLNEQLGVSP